MFSDGYMPILCYIILYCTVLRFITLYIVSYRMSCHVMSCHVMSCHVMSCHVISFHITSLHYILCFVAVIISLRMLAWDDCTSASGATLAWRIYVNNTHESTEDHRIITTKQKVTKLCAYLWDTLQLRHRKNEEYATRPQSPTIAIWGELDCRTVLAWRLSRTFSRIWDRPPFGWWYMIRWSK